MTRLLFFAGSSRADSYNKKLAKLAYDYAKSQGAEATFVDLKGYPMPIYNGDLEDADGLPENAKKFKKLMIDHDGIFIAAPEYNSSLAPLLKNTLDWVSRKEDESEAPLVAFDGKVVAISAASPGGFGGLRGLVPLRMMLGNIKCIVLPEQLAISKAHEAFDEDGTLKNDGQQKMLHSIVDRLIEVTGKLAA